MFRIFIRSMCSIGKSIKTPFPVFGLEGRYVSALYSAAHKKNQLDEVEKHLRDLLNEIDNPRMIHFIESVAVSAKVKGKLIEEACKANGMPDTCTIFLSLVAENGRLKKLKRMISMFLDVVVAHRNEALCEVITATPLDNCIRKALMDALQKCVKGGKKITLTEKVDPSVIGGLIVGIEDKHLDLSIARKIQMYTNILKQTV